MAPSSQVGQATIEAIGTFVLIVILVTAIASAAWIGWIRFELGQLVQELAACLDSPSASGACHHDFAECVHALPGEWQVVMPVRNSSANIKVNLNSKVSDRIGKVLGLKITEWTIDEPKVWHRSQ